MKTIEQAATNAYSIEVLSSGCNAGVTFGKEMFKLGVEFAQKFISLEQELPPKTNPETPYSIPVLIKDESGDNYVAVYDFRLNEFDIFCDVIVGWRPLYFL